MSDSLYIVGNDLGSNDKVAVIFMGDVIYSGPCINGKKLHELMDDVNGAAEFIKYHSCDDEAMTDPIKVIYGGDD